VALVNEKRNEVIVTPDGGVFRPQGRNQLVDLPKHSQVFKSEADFDKELNGLLGDNNINGYGVNPINNNIIVQGNSLTAKDVEMAMKKALSGRPSNNVVIDKKGISTYAVSQFTKSNKLNNRVNFTGINV